MGFHDFLYSINKIRSLIIISLLETKSKYIRHKFGVLWLTLSNIISIIGLGLLWAEIFSIPTKDFIPSLTIGLILWQFYSGLISEAPTIFIRNSHYLKNFRTPLFYYINLHLFRHLTLFAFNIPIILFIFLYYLDASFFSVIISIAGLAISFIYLYMISSFIAVIGAKLRDIESIINSMMPLMFFFTPIIYSKSQVKYLEFILYINPFAFFIELVRAPLLSLPYNLSLYLYAIVPAIFIIPILFIYIGKSKNLLIQSL
jgi:ABC-type polysaccharide/polyol phosphate export permease